MTFSSLDACLDARLDAGLAHLPVLDHARGGMVCGRYPGGRDC
ncbi:MAG: hypothetical protein NVV72_12900 [Asticcacaulis sp.]|nr:hypothetical protein [Asticcacaulis sp.]